MDNQEAIKWLREAEILDLASGNTKDREAVNMAISALQAQEAKAQLSAEGTTSDLISRQDAIEVLSVFTQADALGHTPKQIVEALPSAHPEIEERTEEFAQNVPKEDLISRKAAIDAVKDADVCVAWNGVISNEDAVDIAIRATKRSVIGSIEELPSAQPEVLACGEGVLNAQPEIVRCKACKFYIDNRCYEPHSSIADWRTENDYCSFAERRTNG